MGAIRQSEHYGNQSGQFARDKEVCDHGHEFTPENTRWRPRPNGGRMRVCIACARRRSRLHRIEKQVIQYSRELGILRETPAESEQRG